MSDFMPETPSASSPEATLAASPETAPEAVLETVAEVVDAAAGELPDEAAQSLPEAIAAPEAVPEATAEPAAEAVEAAELPVAEVVGTAEPVAAVVAVVAEPVAEVAEQEPEGESFADIFKEFEQTHQRRSADDARQIRGTVLSKDAEYVYVDIGFKSEGIVPLTAFPGAGEAVQVGDTLLVSVKGRNTDRYYELSLFRTAQPRDWTALQQAFDEKLTIVGNVTGVVKGGLHVDVGVRAFLPASRSGTRDAAEMEALVGTEIRCRVTKLDVQDEDVVVDRRVVLEEEVLATRAESFAAIREGSIVTGTVRSLTDYGAFVDLGGIDGLLHVSDIALTRVTKASDVLTVGQELDVKVLKIDPETHRISLGLKQLQADPWAAAVERYPLGTTVRGVVTRTADFGAFVEIEPGLEGLIHLSEMSWTKRILKATEVVKVGDVLEALVVSVTPGDRRISLSLKQALGDPWVEAAKTLFAGSVVEGPVASITKFGAFVQVAEGVEGLVHISEIVADRRLNHPSDVLRVGQRVQAQVLEIDREKRQLKLSMKQLIPTGLDEFVAEQSVGAVVTGRVIAVSDGQIQVELGDGIVTACALPAEKPEEPVAAVPTGSAAGKVDLSAFSSMLKTKWKTGSAAGETKPKAGAVAAGQVRSFRITELDAKAKRVKVELVP